MGGEIRLQSIGADIAKIFFFLKKLRNIVIVRCALIKIKKHLLLSVSLNDTLHAVC